METLVPLKARIPQEIWDMVIDHFSEDLETLMACSLVCSSWVPCSQRLLHRNLTVSDLYTLLSDPWLYSSHHVARYVQNLEMATLPTSPQCSPERPEPRARLETRKRMWTILSKLPNIFILRIRHLDIQDYRTGVAEPTSYIPSTFPQVTRLVLHTTVFASFAEFFLFVIAFPQLNRLEINQLTWAVEEALLPPGFTQERYLDALALFTARIQQLTFLSCKRYTLSSHVFQHLITLFPPNICSLRRIVFHSWDLSSLLTSTNLFVSCAQTLTHLEIPMSFHGHSFMSNYAGKESFDIQSTGFRFLTHLESLTFCAGQYGALSTTISVADFVSLIIGDLTSAHLTVITLDFGNIPPSGLQWFLKPKPIDDALSRPFLNGLSHVDIRIMKGRSRAHAVAVGGLYVRTGLPRIVARGVARLLIVNDIIALSA